VTINTTGLPANGTWNFGSLVLTELFTGNQTNALSELRLPIGVVVPAVAASQGFLADGQRAMATGQGPRD
jgi:hypothetical protein